MAYKKIREIEALVYVPEQNEEKKKHNCKDCFSCQWCSDTRCELCLKERKCKNNGKNK